jgi:hypothetical protein
MKKFINVMSVCLFLLFGFGSSVFATEAVNNNEIRQHKCKFFGDEKVKAMHVKMKSDLIAFLKLDEETFKQKVKEGKTWAQIAKEQGVSEQALVDFRLNNAFANINDAVKRGVLTVDQAEKMKEHMKANSKNFLNRVPRLHGDHHAGFKGIREDLLKFLKLDQQQFADKLKSGKSLLQIAQEQGITKEQLTNFYLDAEKQMLTKAINEGKITQEKANELMKNFEQQLGSFLSR